MIMAIRSTGVARAQSLASRQTPATSRVLIPNASLTYSVAASPSFASAASSMIFFVAISSCLHSNLPIFV